MRPVDFVRKDELALAAMLARHSLVWTKLQKHHHQLLADVYLFQYWRLVAAE
jgi:hypothetical protein